MFKVTQPVDCGSGILAEVCRPSRSKRPLDLSLLPAPFLQNPTTVAGHTRKTDSLRGLCTVTQHVKAVSARPPSSASNSKPETPGTHGTGCPRGRRCSCSGLCGHGTGAASGNHSSSHGSDSTWRERTGGGTDREHGCMRGETERTLWRVH